MFSLDIIELIINFLCSLFTALIQVAHPSKVDVPSIREELELLERNKDIKQNTINELNEDLLKTDINLKNAFYFDLIDYEYSKYNKFNPEPIYLFSTIICTLIIYLWSKRFFGGNWADCCLLLYSGFFGLLSRLIIFLFQKGIIPGSKHSEIYFRNIRMNVLREHAEKRISL